MKDREKKKASKSTMSLEDAQKALPGLKKASGDAWREVSAFRLKNKYKKDTKFEDKKIQKTHDELVAVWNEAKKKKEEVEQVIASLKPARERNSKYEYPPEANTPDLKKKFRAQQRAAAKAAEKGDKKKEGKKEEKAPKAKKEEAAPEKKKKKKKAKTDD